MLIYQNRVPLHDIIKKENWNRDMTIGILTAMSVEFRQVAAMLGNAQEEKHGTQTYLVGMLGEHKVVLQQCGIGKVNAACGVTQMLMQYQPDCVISTGVAGGIDCKLHVMDVVVSNQVCYHDVWCGEGCDPGQVQGLPTFFPCDKAMLEKALQVDADVKVLPGLICTGDRFITAREELDKIKQDYPEGLAVDMESCAIAQVCHIFGVPFISFRIISDTPGAEAHFEQYQNFWETMADKSFLVTKTFLNSL